VGHGKACTRWNPPTRESGDRPWSFSQTFFGVGKDAQGGHMKKPIAGIAGIAAALLAASAIAQDGVVVTATRFSEYQRDLPVGMTVYSEEDFRRSGATTLPEFLQRVPGLVTRNNSGGPDLQLDLRGFGMTGDQNNVVLVNGVRISENEL